MWTRLLVSLLAIASFVDAKPAPSAHPNLCYESPSLNHPHLAIRNIDKLHKRQYYSGKVTFTHGIASGDPYWNSVIIWTRAVPPGVKEKNHLFKDSRQVCVLWEIAKDKDFKHVVNGGVTETSGEVDYTVKVEATKLQPLTFYYYRFKSCDDTELVMSDVGRTKTFPRVNQDVKNLRLAVYSCANYAEGYYNAYGNPAARDAMDYVLFLGDYQYEFAEPSLMLDRWPKPFRETVSMDDYRLRIATQRTDKDLRLNHENFAWIPVWDDHEVADNGWNNGSSRPHTTERAKITWQQRKLNGMRAYFEWMPIRQVAADNKWRIWRSFQFGKLADLIVMDSRYYHRDKTDAPEEADWRNKTMLGDDQEKWLYGEIRKSQGRGATWKLFGNQIQFSNMNDTAVSGKDMYSDGWMNYKAVRDRFIKKLVDTKSRNNIFLTGDYHALWTSDLMAKGIPYNYKTGEGSIGVELATTSVSSYSGYGVFKTYAQIQDISSRIVADNYQVKWAEGYYRGYMIVTLTPEKLVADYYSIPTVRERSRDEIHAATWEVLAGTNKLKRPFPNPRTGVLQTKLNPWAIRAA